MKPPPARYLFRFDDFCPTMLSAPRERFLSLLARYRVAPILAVIPDNQDPELNLQPPDPQFWDRMRSYQNAGYSIAMHGYRHFCTSAGRPLLRLHKKTEFAGIDESQQRDWIHRGLEVLRANRLEPRLFVAPRHGFDRATLRALAGEELKFLSDGFARRAFTRDGVVWIPQQLWEPVPQTSGLWTICIHTNSAPRSLEDKLERFLAAHSSQCTSYEEVIAGGSPLPLTLTERLAASSALQRIRMRCVRKILTRPA